MKVGKVRVKLNLNDRNSPEIAREYVRRRFSDDDLSARISSSESV